MACWAWMRLRCILESKASMVAAAAMRRAATVADLSSDTRKPVDTCADYGRYLAAGYPIATGVIEGAVPVLGPRPDGVDRRTLALGWSRGGPEAALRASRDFDAYWDFHEARGYQRNHARRYADGIAPPISEPPPPPSPPRLRRVK